MRMRLSGDERALESFPLRLMIVALVAAMSVVPAAEALESLQDKDFLSRAGLMMDKVVFAAQMLAMQGPGASRTVELDLSSEGGLSAARVVIGDAPGGPYGNAVVIELSSGARLIRTALDPPASMTSAHGQSLEVESCRFSLVLDAVLSDGECFVRVEVA